MSHDLRWRFKRRSTSNSSQSVASKHQVKVASKRSFRNTSSVFHPSDWISPTKSIIAFHPFEIFTHFLGGIGDSNFASAILTAYIPTIPTIHHPPWIHHPLGGSSHLAWGSGCHLDPGPKWPFSPWPIYKSGSPNPTTYESRGMILQVGHLLTIPGMILLASLPHFGWFLW